MILYSSIEYYLFDLGIVLYIFLTIFLFDYCVYTPHNYLFCLNGSVISKVEPFPTLL